MELPGGVWRDGRRRRCYAFRPPTGELEMAVAEGAAAPGGLPARVTAVLTAALADLGGAPPDRATVHGLCVGDRQFLMLRLAVWLELERSWQSAVCASCGEPFDFCLEYRHVPVKAAGAGYPYAQAKTAHGQLALRLPSGADQEAILELDEGAAVEALARRCLLDDEARRLPLSAADLQAIEQALEAVAPEVGTRAQAACPQCGALHTFTLDPYDCLGWGADHLFAEVHRIAAAYHWSEGEILALPRARRRRYLGLIDRARGMVG